MRNEKPLETMAYDDHPCVVADFRILFTELLFALPSYRTICDDDAP